VTKTGDLQVLKPSPGLEPGTASLPWRIRAAATRRRNSAYQCPFPAIRIDLLSGAPLPRRALSLPEKPRTCPQNLSPRSSRPTNFGPELARELAKHNLASGYSRDEDFVFATETGKPVYYRNASARGLDKAADKAGLKPGRAAAALVPRPPAHGDHAPDPCRCRRRTGVAVRRALEGLDDSRPVCRRVRGTEEQRLRSAPRCGVCRRFWVREAVTPQARPSEHRTERGAARLRDEGLSERASASTGEPACRWMFPHPSLNAP
jgi:hypothetical protein